MTESGFVRLQKQLRGNNSRSRFTKENGVRDYANTIVPGVLVSYCPFQQMYGMPSPLRKAGLIIAAVLYAGKSGKPKKLALILTEDRLIEIDVGKWVRRYKMRALTKPIVVDGQKELDQWQKAGVTRETTG